MTALDRDRSALKMGVFFSFTAHLALFLIIFFSPHLPKAPRSGMIHYVNVVSLPGGGGGPAGGGGRGEEKIAETPLPKKETLRDLAVPSKLEQEPPSSLRHPVEKPKKEPKPESEKKASIQKQQKESGEAGTGLKGEEEKGSGAGSGAGSGSGIRIGGGGGEGSGSGFSSAFSSQIGLSNFPFTYYLQIIIDRVSSNWFTSLVDPGISGNFQVTVYFKIQRDGQISDLRIEETSGIKSLDLSAQRAVQSSSFPPLPKDYEGEYLTIYLIFEHSK